MVDIDASTGTPRVLARLDGTLTAPAAGAPEDVATALRALEPRGSRSDRVRRRRAALAGDVDGGRRDGGALAPGGRRDPVRRQRTARQRHPRRARAERARRAGLRAWTPTRRRRSPPARRSARSRTRSGVFRSLPRDSGPAGATRATSYADGTDAELTLFNERLAWRVTYRASSREVYDAIVDADTGRVVRKRQPREVRGRRRARLGALSGRRAAAAQPSNLIGLGYLTAGDDDARRAERARVLRHRRRRRSRTAGRSSPPTAAARSPSRSRRSAARAATPRTSARGAARARQLADEPAPERRAGLLSRQPLPRPPQGRADQLHRRRLRGRRRADPADRRRRGHAARTAITSTTRTC